MKFMVFDEKVRFAVVVVDEEAGWGFWRLHSFSGSNSGTKRILQEAVCLEGVCVCVVVVVGVGWWNYTAKSIWPSLSFTAVQFFVPDVMLLLPFWGKRGCSCHFYWRGFIARLNGLKWHLSLSSSFLFFSSPSLTHKASYSSKSKKMCSPSTCPPFTFPPITHAIIQT